MNNPVTLSELLAELRRTGTARSGLAKDLVPANNDAGYVIGGDVTRLLGWSVAGWKIAAIKPRMQKALRTDRPIYGPVYEQFVHPSPCVIDRHLLHPLVEMEYVAFLGSDLPARKAPYVVDEVAQHVSSVHPAIEIAECRFIHDDAFPPLAAILADGAGSGSISYGPSIEDWMERDLLTATATLTKNGTDLRRASAQVSVGHPLEPLTWLANELSAKGIGLRQGQLVSTGSLAGMVLAEPGDHFVGNFGDFGAVEFRYEKQSSHL